MADRMTEVFPRITALFFPSNKKPYTNSYHITVAWSSSVTLWVEVWLIIFYLISEGSV